MIVFMQCENYCHVMDGLKQGNGDEIRYIVWHYKNHAANQSEKIFDSLTNCYGIGRDKDNDLVIRLGVKIHLNIHREKT